MSTDLKQQNLITGYISLHLCVGLQTPLIFDLNLEHATPSFVAPDDSTAQSDEKVSLSLRTEYDNYIDSDDPKFWIPNEKGTQPAGIMYQKEEKQEQGVTHGVAGQSLIRLSHMICPFD